MNVLVTGSSGYIGQQLIHALQASNQETQSTCHIIATDIREEPAFDVAADTEHVHVDVRSSSFAEVVQQYHVDVVVHLAAIVTPSKKSNRAFEYSVDVEGTENVLQSCVSQGVRRVVLTSSGAAYGYHADQDDWLTEESLLRGNQAFAYAYHKRLVEEMLAKYRETYPELEQVIFRIGTILGKNVDNQITNLFAKPVLFGVRGSQTPFVFIWDQDVVACLQQGVFGEQTGIYNLASDGVVTIDDIGEYLGKRVWRLPAWLLKGILFVLKRLRLTQYGEEQVAFIRYRPVLDNRKLKQTFGFTPSYDSKQVFLTYLSYHDL